MNIDITQIIIVIIQLIIAPMLILGIKEGIAFLKTKALAVTNEAAQKRALYYIDLAASAIQTAVVETQQTFVDCLKGTSGWDSAKMQEAFIKSRNRAIDLMGTAVYDGLGEVIEDMNKWITAKIEESVHETKVSVLTPLIGEVKIHG